MKKNLLLTLLFALITAFGFSQTDRSWSANNESLGNIITDKAVARVSFPAAFKLFNLNIEPLRQELMSVVDRSSKHSTVISLPNADGGIEKFEVFEASNFEPALQARFPQIRAFSGKGITDKYATLKLSISPQGIQTMVFRTEKENEFIEAYSKDHTIYAVFRSHREKGSLPWVCTTEDKQIATDINAKIGNTNTPSSNAGELRTVRLAQSCNGEYSNWFGASTAGTPADQAIVLAAFNGTLTRCNGCYEKDLALHLNLIPATVNVIFYNPATDPYTTMGAWNGQLQTTLTNIIGEANYDIGHMFGASGGGGNAGCIGCVCVNGQKGSGITSPADGIPMGDNFDIDYVVHEVGHQLGGNHTFSHNLEGTGQNKEVGAGITIMGYAGITSYDPAPHSIDIYHETSIQQIQVNLAGKACPITTNITANNATPVVAPVSNYTIPISTPFALTGSATDANAGDVLTYCWEQNDNATTSGANSVASPTKATGPNWLSFSPSPSPTRYCPRLSTILAGLLITPTLPGGDAVCNIEALSSISRTLNFRLTVRDNCPYVPVSPGPGKIGQTAFTDMAVTVTNTSGPFQVTSPNTNVSWNTNSTQTITWDVNNTTAAPVSCANVKISLSTDGGQTFPTVFLASTTNDGSETVTIPNTPTTTARIKVESIGNIFFDISNSNFTIVAAGPDFGISAPAPASVTCPANPANIPQTVATSSANGFVTPITFTATAGVPAGTNVTFSPNPVTPGNNVTVTLNNANTLSFGSYPITITGTAGAIVHSATVTYVIQAGAGPNITQQPNTQSLCAGGTVTFTVAATGALTYQWQKSTDGGATWNNVGGATGTSYTIVNVQPVDGGMYRNAVSGQCNLTNSNAATLTVQTPPAFTSQPTASTVCGASSPSFSVAATGAGLGYQWQVTTSGGCAGVWNNVNNGGVYSGATTATLTITPTSVAMNGYAYRCVASGTCSPSATSNCVILTVNTPVAITAQPANSTICAGSNTSFTTAASGTTPSYQWQLSTDGGATWNNVSNGGVYGGATTATLTLTGVTAGMTGYQYRTVVTGAAPCASVNSNGAILTVQTAPAITGQPVASTTLCAGNNTTYSVVANGTALSYQWQVSTNGGGSWTNISNGGVYSGATSATLTITGALAAMNTYQYRAVVSGTCTPAANSTAGALTVNTPISVITQPAAATNICATGTISLTTVVTGTSPTYQWQESTNGGTSWANVTNGGVYSGATTNILTLSSVTAGMNGYIYRTVITGTAPCGPVNSNNAVLNVTPQPVISATSTSLLAGQQSTLTVNVSPAPGLSFAWYLNGVLQAGTGNSIIADVNSLGNYMVVVTSATGSCQSQLIEIKAEPSSRLFIFPSPNNGQFKVSYYNAGASLTNQTTQSITIYDSYGRRVHTKVYIVSQAYQLHQIDMRGSGAGVYYVILREANGNKVKTGEVIVR